MFAKVKPSFLYGNSLTLSLCISLSTLISGTAFAGSEYRFSPVNQYDINLTAAYWNPIISYVSEKVVLSLS